MGSTARVHLQTENRAAEPQTLSQTFEQERDRLKKRLSLHEARLLDLRKDIDKTIREIQDIQQSI